MSFSNGLVTVVAIEATPRQILTEWSRQGQVRITNLDRLSGGPVTLQLVGAPEAQALETLLRGTAGYVAALRTDSIVAGSSYDRILLMPGVAPAMPASSATPAPTSNMSLGRGRAPVRPAFDPDTDDDAGAAWAVSGTGQAAGRDPARLDPNRQPGPGQIVMPLVMPQAPAAVNQRQPSVVGASTPGVFTAPPKPPPGQTAGAPVSTGQPPTPGPYGLPSPVRPPTPPTTAVPTGPIK